MRRHRSSTPGFTIVEIIVVIAILGVLAAVTIASYSNIKRNTRNVRTISTATAYERALMTYLNKNNSYPAMDPNAGGVCLGIGYKDRVGGDGIGDCGETAWPLKEDTIFNDSLKQLVSSLPIVNDTEVKMPYQSTTFVGAAFHYFPPDPTEPLPEDQGGFIVDGVSSPYYIMYVLEGGNQDCGNGNILATDDANGGWPRMTRKRPSGQHWTYSDNKATACVIYMPNP